MAAVDLGIDCGNDREDDHADGDVDLLSEDVVVGIAGDVMAGDGREHPEAVRADAAHRHEQEVVDVAKEGAELGSHMGTGCGLWERSGCH